MMKRHGFSTHSLESSHDRLSCRNRPRLLPADFELTDKLYRGFAADELDDDGCIDTNTLRLPDLSCNWGRFSLPGDVRHRMLACERDGCYSISVGVARHASFATPCHDPICGEEIENYSHVEVRELLESESVLDEPPKGRKKRRKVLRAEWKTNIINQLQREFEPEAS